MTMPKNDANGVRYKNIIRDATSFVLNIQTERANGGYTFDGVDRGYGNIQTYLHRTIQVSRTPFKGSLGIEYKISIILSSN